MSITTGKRYERASRHATRSWECSICGKKCVGNGGKSSHKKKHLRDSGVSFTPDDYRYRFVELSDSLRK